MLFFHLFVFRPWSEVMYVVAGEFISGTNRCLQGALEVAGKSGSCQRVLPAVSSSSTCSCHNVIFSSICISSMVKSDVCRRRRVHIRYKSVPSGGARSSGKVGILSTCIASGFFVFYVFLP